LSVFQTREDSPPQSHWDAAFEVRCNAKAEDQDFPEATNSAADLRRFRPSGLFCC